MSEIPHPTQALEATVEAKVRLDIESALAQIVPDHRFLVQASAHAETTSIRRIIEGEDVREGSLDSKNETAPALPGFVAPPEFKQSPKTASKQRQVYQQIDREVLRSVGVDVTLDETLDDALIPQVQRLVRKYLEKAYGTKAHVDFHRIRMSQPTSPPPPELVNARVWIPVLLGTGLALLATSALCALYVAVKRASRSSSPKVAENARPLAHERGAHAFVSADPAERAECLELILANAHPFRNFYLRLDEERRSMLCQAMRGPAFQSAIEALALSVPKTSIAVEAGFMGTVIRDFKEFLKAWSWQNKSHFGFVPQLSDAEALILVRQESAEASALILQMLPPERSARLLGQLSELERTSVLAARPATLGSDDVVEIERRVRARIQSMPAPLISAPRSSNEAAYWCELLDHADNEATLLAELQRQKPELERELKRSRFQLESMLTLPDAIISRACGDLSNEELAFALKGCAEDVRARALSALGAERRALIVNQLTALSRPDTGAEARALDAKRALSKRFMEELRS